jgi:hypothetical protein
LSTKIEVLDAIMGSGKTQGIIKWMLDNPNNKYLYISPMLTEVEERIPNSCEAIEFAFPNTEEHTTKSRHLLDLLKTGCNISFTHSLFSELSQLHLDEIKKQKYVMIIDEEVSLIEPYKGKYSKGDITSLEEAGHLRVDESNLGKVEWLWDTMTEGTQYSGLKRLCSIDMLYCSKRDRDMMVTQLPMALVESAERTIILSYLFKGSVMESFLKLKGLEVVDFTEVELMKDTEDVLMKAKDLINFCSIPSTEAVKKYSMSSTWYTTNANKEQLKKIGAAIRGVYRKAGKEKLLITLPKDSTEKIVNKSKNIRLVIPKEVMVADIFLYCGARATNDYAEKSVALHAYNRYVNRVVQAYLQDYGSELDAVPDDDQFALSEMVQWLWRTRIRNDQPIDVYILPSRMERLLKKWLEGGYP